MIDGHSTGETWGLALDPITGIVLTSGDDNKIIAFDPKTNNVVGTSAINSVPG